LVLSRHLTPHIMGTNLFFDLFIVMFVFSHTLKIMRFFFLKDMLSN